MKKALIILADGFEDIEAIAVIDILRRGGVEVTTASAGSSRAVTSSHKIELQADALLSGFTSLCNSDADDSAFFDAIILPGGQKGTENLKKSELTGKLLLAHRDAGALICAICAAPTVLAHFDILSEDDAFTCYPGCEEEIGLERSEHPVVAHDLLITGNGPGSAMIFGFVILQNLCGEDVAAQVASAMQFNEW